MPQKIALVAGATGATAKRLVEQLAVDPSWRVVGLCRNTPPNRERLTYVSADPPQHNHEGGRISFQPGNVAAGGKQVAGERRGLLAAVDGRHGHSHRDRRRRVARRFATRAKGARLPVSIV